MDGQSEAQHIFWNIPNVLTLMRFALIPLIIWLYVGRDAYIPAAVVMGISAVTDICDGIIARKFNMITDIGKIIDPIADKLTQAAVIFCLSLRYNTMWALFFALAVKEVTMAVMGLMAMRRKSINGAKWYGKACTVVLFFVIVFHIIFPELPQAYSTVLVSVGLAVMALALVMYIRFYFRLLKEHKA